MRKRRKKRRFRPMRVIMMTAVVLFAAGFSAQGTMPGWPEALWAGLSGTGHSALALSGGAPTAVGAGATQTTGLANGASQSSAAGAGQGGSAEQPGNRASGGPRQAASADASADGAPQPAPIGAGGPAGADAAPQQAAAALSASRDALAAAGMPQPAIGKPAPEAADVMLSKPTLQPAVYKAKPGSKLVALTFDDGPDARYTPAILDILQKANIHATFFTVGTQVKKYPNMMKRIAREGHEIGNHTYHHPDLSKLSDNKIKDEILWTDSLIQRAVGYVPDLVRAPYGAVSPSLKEIVKENGRTLVGWTVDTRDWAGSTVAEMRANVDKNTRPGGIVLMHSFGGKYIKNTPELLPLIIKDLQAKGYTFVTVDQLLASKAEGKAKE